MQWLRIDNMNNGYSEILEAISSEDPTPGGGSVAALVLAHSHSLAIMVSKLTIRSEKWSDGHNSASRTIENSQIGITKSLDLANDDAKAFDSVMDAYRLPKSTEKELKDRKTAIRDATLHAAEVPLETAEEASKLLQSIKAISGNCNANALTDLASSAELAKASLSMAAYNVRINLDSLDEEISLSINNRLAEVIDEADSTFPKILLDVSERLGW